MQVIGKLKKRSTKSYIFRKDIFSSENSLEAIVGSSKGVVLDSGNICVTNGKNGYHEVKYTIPEDQVILNKQPVIQLDFRLGDIGTTYSGTAYLRLIDQRGGGEYQIFSKDMTYFLKAMEMVSLGENHEYLRIINVDGEKMFSGLFVIDGILQSRAMAHNVRLLKEEENELQRIEVF